MLGGVLLQELLPKGRCACPLHSPHSGFICFFLSLVMHLTIILYSHFIPSLTCLFAAHIFLSPISSKPLLLSLSSFSFTYLFVIPLFSLLPSSPLRHQLYTHRLCFHGVSHRFWQSALETQDHFK